MLIYLCRHAHALPGAPDAERALSPAGEAQAAALGERLDGQAPRPTLVLTSPLRRAHQTAEAVAGALGVPLQVEPRLAPGATPAALLAAARESGAPALVTVGHQPDCSEIALAVTGSDPGFPPAGLAVLELAGPA